MSSSYPPRWITACTGLRDRLRVAIPEVVIPTTGDRLAVIVEMRDDPFLETVMEIFIRQLAGRGWRFCLMHGRANVELAHKLYKTWPGISMIQLGVENLTVQMYNDLLLSDKFWDILPGAPRTILRFELDTVLINGEIERFCEYDYVGAPWHPRLKWAGPEGRVGNGGLTIRNVEAMKRTLLLHKKPGARYNSEDGFFCIICGHTLRFPSVELARQFAVESWPIEDSPLPCGFHKPWAQLGKKAILRVYKIIESAYKTDDDSVSAVTKEDN